MRYRVPILTLLVTVGLCIVIAIWNGDGVPEQLTAIRKLAQKNPAEAFSQCLTLVKQHPESIAGLQQAIDLADQLHHTKIEWDLRRQFLKSFGDEKADLLLTARAGLESGFIEEAENLLLKLLKREPRNRDCLRELATLWLSLTRTNDARALLLELVRQRSFLLHELIMLGSHEEAIEDRPLLERALVQDPGNPVVLTAIGRLSAWAGEHERAVTELKSAISTDRAYPPAAVGALGRSLIVLGRVNELTELQSQLLIASKSDPESLFVRAWLAVHHGSPVHAIPLAARALAMNPLHRPATQLLGQQLVQGGETAAGELWLQRAAAMDEVERVLHRILFGDKDAKLIQRVAELMDQLQRPSEADAWKIVLATYYPNEAATVPRNSTFTEHSGFQVIPEVMDQLRQFAARETPTDDPITGSVTISESSPGDLIPISFRDVAAESGLTIPYYGGLEDLSHGIRIFESFGGGVAALDADSDGKTDLYFVHGNRWPADSAEPRSRNRMYRQVGQRYQDVTDLSGAADSGFGQGIAVGDFNSDGFDDLYVANIGMNRLYRNNGDGTWSDATPAAVQRENRWTTSCLMVDLNGDGFDDLYDVNYCDGQEPFERRCQSGEQQLHRGCKPDLFQGAPDQCLLSMGNGEFQLVTEMAGIDDRGGRGLGVIAGDFDESGTIDLFVANDMTHNALLINSGMDPSALPRFSEEAMLRGVALNGAGRVEAGMGIAAGDVTEDGLTDFLVTKFYGESNTLYAMNRSGFFLDVSAPSGAAAGSLQMLTFGTQFLDADNDGHMDILLVNGNVDDFTHLDIPFKMPPAAYRNLGASQFVKLPESSLGEYGLVPRLGRAMARLDWNADGRDDAIVTHLDGAPSLLENSTSTPHKWMAISLIGTESSRTGCGSVLRIVPETGAESTEPRVVHAFAGDGYFCANDRRITVGLGTAASVRSIEVRWPSGARQVWTELEAGRCYRMIEGRTSAEVIQP